MQYNKLSALVVFERYVSRAACDIILARCGINNIKEYNLKESRYTAAEKVNSAIELLMKYSLYNKNSYQEHGSGCIETRDLNELYNEYCLKYDVYIPKNIAQRVEMYSRWKSVNHKVYVRTDSVVKAIQYVEDWISEICNTNTQKIQKEKSID